MLLSHFGHDSTVQPPCTVDKSWISVLLSQCGHNSTVQPPCTVDNSWISVLLSQCGHNSTVPPPCTVDIAEYPCYCHNVDTILQYNHHAHCTVDNSWISVLLSQCGYDSTVQPPCTVMTKAEYPCYCHNVDTILNSTYNHHAQSWQKLNIHAILSHYRHDLHSSPYMQHLLFLLSTNDQNIAVRLDF